ncbi:ribonuclease Z [Marchantia polymorpha subsp. ruderalis]|uniref:ribonuclease Z n=1 Tax=Marchantia polymorpha subsp. ruderalis TaxID=1480154 RepID=A0AAF6BLF7_MARPO|nr:hypothetical protein Mp_5g23320 [Marchantia polymorpha subsp. ruderalis]
MEAVTDSTGYELRVLHAAADGVEPALLLSAPKKKAEYLLNVPDGFSRLALEHKSTPSGRLSCILLTSLLPAATGGFGGLMLRLRHDGHGQLQMIGPEGTTAIVHSLRHVCRWRHPKVFVSECRGNRPLPVFEDEYIVIVPVVEGDQATECPWCLYGATSEIPKSEQQKKAPSVIDSATSSSSESSESSDDSSEDSSDSSRALDREVSSRPTGSNGILPQRRKREENAQSFSDTEEDVFDQLRLKIDKSRRDRMDAFSKFPRVSPTIQAPASHGIGESIVLHREERKETLEEHLQSAPEQEVYEVGSVIEKGVLPQDCSVSPMKPYNWLLNNDQDVELPDVDEEANPVFQLAPSPGKQPDAASGRAGSTGPSSVLGYVCYLRKLRTAVLIIACTSEENLESLREHPLVNCPHRPDRTESIERGESRVRKAHSIAAVVDLSPRSITKSREYELWIESLRSSGPHVVVKRAHGEFGFQSSLATLAKLNCIHKSIFPLPPSMDVCGKTDLASAKQAAADGEKLLDGALGMRLIFDKSGTWVDHSMCPTKLMKLQEALRQSALHSPDTRGDELLAAIGTPSILSANAEAAAALRKKLQLQRTADRPPLTSSVQSSPSAKSFLHSQQEASLEPFSCSENSGPISHRSGTPVHRDVNQCELDFDFQLVFFGTGCAEPSKKRGSSGILLQVKGTDRALLMEAGEGVAGQFVRRFGDEEAQTIISSLECLWLSHKHGDHVLGVLSILEARRQQREPMVVIGPQKVGSWLFEVRDIRAAMGCPVPEFHFIRCQDLVVAGRFLADREQRKLFDRVLANLQLQSLRLIRVFHCFDAYGIILRGKSGWSLVYSGDTRPCKQLEQAGHGCTVLIHEATFEDELIEQAKQKRHSTVSEALKAGMNMGAQNIILTHFSQRYPEMVAMCSDQDQRVSVAFDGMVVPSHLLGSLSRLLPSIASVCLKVDRTKPSETDKFTHEDSYKPANHEPPAQITEKQEDDDLGSVHLAASHRGSGTRTHVECEERPVAKPNHIRWSGDSEEDEGDVGAPAPHLDVEDASIQWSSDSGADESLKIPEFQGRSSSLVCSEDAGAVALVLDSGVTLVAPREANRDVLLTSATELCRDEVQGLAHSVDRPRLQKSKTGSRRALRKSSFKSPGTAEVVSSVDHFLKGIDHYGRIGSVGLYENGENCTSSSLDFAGSRSNGGKHIRWIDSDTED